MLNKACFYTYYAIKVLINNSESGILILFISVKQCESSTNSEEKRYVLIIKNIRTYLI